MDHPPHFLSDAHPWPVPVDLAPLLTAAYRGVDLGPIREQLLARLEENPRNSATLLDLAFVDQLLMKREDGLRWQARALALDRIYRSSWPATPGALRVLAFMTEGDISANTPIGFLLEDPGMVLYSYYVAPDAAPAAYPEHDVAIVVVGESDEATPVMAEIAKAIAAWPVPVLNAPERILRLSRELTYRSLEGAPGLVMPGTVRIGRDRLAHAARDPDALRAVLPDAEFPLIARPIGSHAGRGLAKLPTPAAIVDYLAEQAEPEFYLSRFVEYRSPDGRYRKYRIVWIDGQAFPVHMAIADDWMIWYLNANMDGDAAKRAEEQRFMEAFDQDFGHRHAAALAAAADRFGLEYSGIDCAETPDGRLLVFEADVSMIVHNLDSPVVFPYKAPVMRRLFAAFQDMLRRHARPRA